MKRTFVTSDQHFNHAAILTFTNAATGQKVRSRFKDCKHMNEYMIEMWNAVVAKNDIVWQLGDFCMKDYEGFERDILPKLNGHISMVIGNHDNVRALSRMNRIRKIVADRRFEDKGLIMSHRPLHFSNCWSWRTKSWMRNLHGHIHEHDSPTDHDYINLSVEKTNYMPIDIESLVPTKYQLEKMAEMHEGYITIAQ